MKNSNTITNKKTEIQINKTEYTILGNKDLGQYNSKREVYKYIYIVFRNLLRLLN